MTALFPPPCASRPETSPPTPPETSPASTPPPTTPPTPAGAPAARLVARTPSRALAEAMGAAATCRHGPCAALPPLWPDLARAVGLDAPARVLHARSAEALRCAVACRRDCPAAAALHDVPFLALTAPSRRNAA